MKKRDYDGNRTFTRRALLIGAMQGTFLTVLGGRLAWLQIAQGQRYRTLAENNRINTRMLAPSRGLIVDRNGFPLAVNSQNFRAVIVPEQTENIETALSRLQKLIPLTQRDIQRVVKQAQKNPPFTPLEVRDHLNWEEVSRVEVNLPDLPGLSIDEGEIRYYPAGTAVAHLVGYVGAVNKAEQSGGDPLLTLPGFMIGKTGAEKAYDDKLRGAAGSVEMEVNVVGREVRELGRHPSRPGSRVALTIDDGLQQFAQTALEKHVSASAVVMDAHTGAVYALASAPAVDPNEFTHGISADRWEEFMADPALPLNNKAVGGQYPPGSTFKLVTALAALETGVITANTTAFCPGHYDYGDSRFHCWKPAGHGTVDVYRALAESCDTFFYKLSTELGVDRLAETARKLGLGERLGFEMSEERPGLIPTKAWKEAQFGESWQPGESIVASIGQGYTLATPLQLATMTARIVNGGKAVRPWITGQIGDAPPTVPPDWPQMGFKKKYLDMIVDGMDRVVNGAHGTAGRARITEPGFAMGGKTGTAQVKRITKEERSAGVHNEDLPWRFRHHALFVGFAPVEKPRYVCCVVVEHGGGGSAVAAPVAHDILLEVQKRDLASRPVDPLAYQRPQPETPVEAPPPAEQAPARKPGKTG